MKEHKHHKGHHSHHAKIHEHHKMHESKHDIMEAWLADGNMVVILKAIVNALVSL
jgi:hypothetical protein